VARTAGGQRVRQAAARGGGRCRAGGRGKGRQQIFGVGLGEQRIPVE